MSYPPISPPPGELFELCGFEKLQNHKMNNIIIFQFQFLLFTIKPRWQIYLGILRLERERESIKLGLVQFSKLNISQRRESIISVQ